ncbi:MAG: chromate transporter [Chloroflexota bacterium]|nr:chromate transporter [Chloroflexota bacterium]MDQ6907454.1 chromate transporter [Chloroflexota bacterium]
MQASAIPPDEAPLPLPEEQAAVEPHSPPLKEIFLTWLRIGAFSFGGGAATLFLMRREFVQRHRWLTGDQYNEAFALSKLTPGTNIIAQSIVMGKMMAGAGGVVASLTGLLAPAVTITTLLSAFITFVQGNRVAGAVLAGIVPATGGLTFAIVVQMGGGQLGQGWDRVRGLVVMLACGLLVGLVHLPVPLILLTMGTLGALFPHLLGIHPATPATPRPMPTPDEATRA